MSQRTTPHPMVRDLLSLFAKPDAATKEFVERMTREADFDLEALRANLSALVEENDRAHGLYQRDLALALESQTSAEHQAAIANSNEWTSKINERIEQNLIKVRECIDAIAAHDAFVGAGPEALASRAALTAHVEILRAQLAGIQSALDTATTRLAEINVIAHQLDDAPAAREKLETALTTFETLVERLRALENPFPIPVEIAKPAAPVTAVSPHLAVSLLDKVTSRLNAVD